MNIVLSRMDMQQWVLREDSIWSLQEDERYEKRVGEKSKIKGKTIPLKNKKRQR